MVKYIHVNSIRGGKVIFWRKFSAAPCGADSKSYRGKKADLTHYDFYRLGDPGLMMDDLAESISDPRLVTVVEWAQSVQDILPADRKIITIKYIDENTRELIEQ